MKEGSPVNSRETYIRTARTVIRTVAFVYAATFSAGTVLNSISHAEKLDSTPPSGSELTVCDEYGHPIQNPVMGTNYKLCLIKDGRVVYFGQQAVNKLDESPTLTPAPAPAPIR